MSQTLRESETLKVKEAPQEPLKVKEAPQETLKVKESPQETLKVWEAQPETVLESEAPAVINVFTHSSTSFSGAWPEEDVNQLLDCWLEVVEQGRGPTRRYFDVAQKVVRRLKAQGWQKVIKDTVKKQMKRLETEFMVFQGLIQIGIPTVRAPCVDYLERILGGRRPPSRQGSRADDHGSVMSEDSDCSRLSVSYGGKSALDEEAEVIREVREVQEEDVGGEQPNNEEEASVGQNKKGKFQRRINIRRLMQQQQATFAQLLKTVQASEETNSRLAELLAQLLTAFHQQTLVHEKVLAALSSTTVDNASAAVVSDAVA